MTDLLLAIIAAAVVGMASRPAIDRWTAHRRYKAYRRAVLANGWFDPQINPSATKYAARNASDP